MSSWEHFPHQADVGVRGLGATLAEAFEQAALALTAVIVDPADVAPSEMIRLSCAAPDAELLLVDWLNKDGDAQYAVQPIRGAIGQLVCLMWSAT